jgi:lipid A 3-O-deacylase
MTGDPGPKLKMPLFSSFRSGRDCAVTFILALTLFSFLPGPLVAQPALDVAGEASSSLSLGLGYFGVATEDGPALSIEVAYRLPGLLSWGLAPQVGVAGTTEGSLYGFGGLMRSVDLPSGLVLTASVGAGLYRRGGGLDLGGTLEFRSGVALGRKLGDRDRISIYLYHLSNAGLGDRNPGVEVLGIGYTLGLR